MLVQSTQSYPETYRVLFSPGVLTTQLVLVAPGCGGLGFLAVFPQEGHGSLEILVRLQAKQRIYQSSTLSGTLQHLRDDSIKSGTNAKPSDRGGDEEQQEQFDHSVRGPGNTRRTWTR